MKVIGFKFVAYIYLWFCNISYNTYQIAGVPYLSNYQSTRIYINPDHYSVKELRKRLLTFTFNIILLNFHQLNNRIFFSWVNKSRVQVPEKKIEATPEPTPPPTIKILTVKEIRNIKSELKQVIAFRSSSYIGCKKKLQLFRLMTFYVYRIQLTVKL